MRLRLLSYGTVNSDATMEHETRRQRSNSYARKIRGIVRSGVLCGSVQMLYLENRITTIVSRIYFLRAVKTYT
jgi:hypothetical protein